MIHQGLGYDLRLLHQNWQLLQAYQVTTNDRVWMFHFLWLCSYYWLTWCCPVKLGGNPNWLGHPSNQSNTSRRELWKMPTFLKPWLMYIGNWIWDFLGWFLTTNQSSGREGIKKDNRFCVALFDIFSLSILLLDKCHLTRHLTHWKSIFPSALLLQLGLSWKVVRSHSFLICLDIVRIKYGFLSD